MASTKVEGRLLLEGSARVELSDLLYFDAVVPRSLPDQDEYGGNHSEVLAKLLRAELAVPREDLLDRDTLTRLDVEYRSACISMDNAIRAQGNLPFVNPASAGFLLHHYEMGSRVFDLSLRRLANAGAERGIRCVPKLRSNHFRSTASQAPHTVLSIVYSQFPTLDPDRLDIEELIDFLKDTESVAKRRRLNVWQNNIEEQVSSGKLKIEHIPDMMASLLDDYTQYLKLARLKLDYTAIETILIVSANIIAGLTLLGLPKAIENIISFKRREIELHEAELKAPGRELAYITHVREKLG